MGGQQQGGLAGMLIPIALFVCIFYFMLIRPQKKKQQQHESMLSSITRGDTVVTAGGFFGKVTDILDDSYIIELADGVKVRILKSSISIRREPQDGASKPPRPRRKDRPRGNGERKRAAREGGSNEEVAENGVTTDETSALTASSSEEVLSSTTSEFGAEWSAEEKEKKSNQ